MAFQNSLYTVIGFAFPILIWNTRCFPYRTGFMFPPAFQSLLVPRAKYLLHVFPRLARRVACFPRLHVSILDTGCMFPALGTGYTVKRRLLIDSLYSAIGGAVTYLVVVSFLILRQSLENRSIFLFLLLASFLNSTDFAKS